MSLLGLFIERRWEISDQSMGDPKAAALENLCSCDDRFIIAEQREPLTEPSPD